jgi:transposase InsO family protein
LGGGSPVRLDGDQRRSPVPWKEIRPVDDRVRFIAAVQEDPKGNFAELCRRFGIHRSKGYKWLQRYNELGPAGLEDRKPIPGHCPHATSDALVDRLVALRKEHPYEGPRKLRARLLRREPGLDLPAASTIGAILDRHGLIRPRRARIRVPAHPSPLEPCASPNDLWCVDFKGHFAVGDGTRCHPLTVSDGASRYLIRCEALTEPKEDPVRRHFELAFREFGLPERIRSDNGAPFATKAIGGLSRLSVWWIQLGILPERIEPGHPEQNGRHERMHRTLKQSVASPPQPTMADQQRSFDRFRRDYNEERPHEALGQTPPAAHYEPSLRTMPEKPREPSYAADVTVRRVSPTGGLSWLGQLVRIGRILASQPMGLRQTDEDEWELFYGPLLVGYLLRRNGQLRIEPVG